MSVFDDSPPKKTAPKSFLVTLMQILIVIPIIVLPGFVTLIPFASASGVKLERVDGRVIAKTQRYMFFIIPVRTEHVDPVVSVDTNTDKGSVKTERRSGKPDKKTKADDQGYLVVKGPETSSEVPANSFSLESLRTQTKAFMQDSQAKELKFYLLGNPLFSIVFGGGATLLSLLLAVSTVIHFVQWVMKTLGVEKNQQKRSGS